MSRSLQNNPRLWLLIVALIMVAGCVAFTLLPRMEDPRLTPRAARVITVLPGADAERVESLVTEKLEKALREIEEIKEIRSTSSSNVSFVGIELADEVNEMEAENVWSRVRDKAEDARRSMPPETLRPVFKKYDITASAVILALRWDREDAPNYAILHRLIKQLRDHVDDLPGTEKTELFGAPEEEILVTLDAEAMTAMNLSPGQISAAIAASDAKVAAGVLRSQQDNILLEVAGELDTLKRIGKIPVQLAGATSFVELADVAKIEKTIKQPLESKVVLQDRAAIALGVQIQPRTRLDLWASDLNQVLSEFEATLPQGITLRRVFEQEKYVGTRMASLAQNLLFGGAAILVVILFMMGWRAALAVGLALPLVSLTVLTWMQWLGIPIHQMSITGLIIALGLMIDNAIVVVDEIAQRLTHGDSRQQAVRRSTQFLLPPLLGSTVTTALSFSPIILMQGPAGEFVGAIALVAVLAVVSSLMLALFIIAPLAGNWLSHHRGQSWPATGLSFSWLTGCYRGFIRFALANPAAAVVLTLSLPMLGFIFAIDLPEQFFPAADRNQFQLEIELPSTTSIEETERYAKDVRQQLLKDPAVKDVKWFLGESAPMFYYNVIPTRQNESYYAQAIVECQDGCQMVGLLRKLQTQLESEFPKASVLARQLEQGPPFDAPIEVRLEGPDQATLRRLGDQLRLLLTQTQHVFHTRAGFSEPSPKLTFEVDEQQARMAGLSYQAIARELNTSLEGIVGGSIIEATEELPVRVRVSGEQRQDINSVASMDLLVQGAAAFAARRSSVDYPGVPLGAISTMKLDVETVSIMRLNGRRMNEVQAFVDAGVLPAGVLAEFQQRLAKSDIELPPGYQISYGGADEERNDAVRSLIGNSFVIVALMITSLIVALRSFRLSALLFLVAGLSVGLGLGALWLLDFPWGFMSMVAIMGMIGVAVNDSIVVLASIRDLPEELTHDRDAIADKVVASTRHILSTTITTIVGFTPLFLYGGDFWSPVATAISGGVGGATMLALVTVPCIYVLIQRRANDSAG